MVCLLMDPANQHHLPEFVSSNASSRFNHTHTTEATPPSDRGVVKVVAMEAVILHHQP